MVFQEWIHELSKLVTRQHLTNLLTAIVIILLGVFFARRAQRAVSRIRTLDVPQRMLFQKVAYYGLVIIALAAALDTLGFDLKVLLGAAGVLTVAIGFAAQTSASNLISGLFLMFERPFVVGNTVSVGDIRGEVVAIDLLSTKIRTFSNLMIRVPNETLVKSNIVNLSYFPIRRVEIEVGVSYAADLRHVEKVIRETIEGHPHALREPLAQINVKGFGASSIDFTIQVWTQTVNVSTMANDLYRALDLAFRDNKIEIPFPTRTLISATQ